MRVVPANAVSWADLATVFGERGPGARCFCQRYKLARGEAFKHHPPAERARRLREQTRCGDPAAAATSGLVGYAAGEPAGWCAVEPRTAYFGMARVARVPWEGRDEDRDDASVWAVTCVFARPGYRRRGVGTALAGAAVGFARSRGARALEAYPMRRDVPFSGVIEEFHVGTEGMFTAAGLTPVTRPGTRRVVMRIDYL